MPQRFPITNYNTSLALKQAKVSKGIAMPINDLELYYDANLSEFQCIISSLTSAGNYFRTIRKDLTGTAFDLVSPSDTNLVKAYIKRELETEIGAFPGVESSSGTKPGLNWVWTIVRNGQNYTGTDLVEVEAMIKAYTNVINAS